MKFQFSFIYVELTSICNMDCTFCVNSRMSRPKKHLDFELFKKTIDEIAEHKLTKLIQLSALGESALYPRLLEAVEYCSKKGLESSLVTNSIVLTPDLYLQLLEKGLADLYVSLHNLSEASFAYRRCKTKIDYSAFLQNILNIVDTHTLEKLPNTLVIALMFSKTEWKHSELWDLPAFKKDTMNVQALLPDFLNNLRSIAEKNGSEFLFDENLFNIMLDDLNPFEVRTVQLMKNIVLNLVPLNAQLFNTREKLNSELKKHLLARKRTKGSCRNIDTPMILSNGSVIPCCYDGLEEVVMGKVDKETSLISVLEGEKYQNLITGFQNNIISHPVCQECMGMLRYTSPLRELNYLLCASWKKAKNSIRKLLYYRNNLSLRQLLKRILLAVKKPRGFSPIREKTKETIEYMEPM